MIFGRCDQSWEVDHTCDAMPTNQKLTEISIVSQKSDGCHFSSHGIMPVLTESIEEKNSRRRSHWVIHTTMLFVSIGFSIVISGIFPYLKILENDSNLSKTNLGWVIAANPLGMMISSPIIGYIANKLGSVRKVAYFTMAIFSFANIAYGLLPRYVDLWDHSAFHIMLLSRFAVGISSGIIVLCRSYLASSTTISERTGAFAILSASESIGYIIGPAIQMILSLVITDDRLKYQAAGFVTAALGGINFVLMTPIIFQEFDIATRELVALKKLSKKVKVKILPKKDFLGLIGIMFAYFIGQFLYILLEVLLEPFVQDQYAWCDDLSVVVVGIILSVSGVIFLVMFLVTAKLAKRFDERKLLIILGVGVLIIGVLLLLPWGPNELHYCSESNSDITQVNILPKVKETSRFNKPVWNIYQMLNSPFDQHEEDYFGHSDVFYTVCGNVTDCLGCPPQQKWCLNVPQLPMWQLLLACTIIMTSLPVSISMTNTIFSKMLGPTPQGTWMGFFSSIGSAAHMLGPLYVSYVYTNLGTRYTFSIVAAILLVGGLGLLYLYQRIVPMKVREVKGKP